MYRPLNSIRARVVVCKKRSRREISGGAQLGQRNRGVGPGGVLGEHGADEHLEAGMVRVLNRPPMLRSVGGQQVIMKRVQRRGA